MSVSAAFRPTVLLRTRASLPRFNAPPPPNNTTPPPPRPPPTGPVRPGSRRISPTTPPASADTSDVEPASAKVGSKKTLVESWKSLPPKTRKIIGISFFVFALIGEIVSTKLQEKLPEETVDEDAQRRALQQLGNGGGAGATTPADSPTPTSTPAQAEEHKPRFLGVRFVDRQS